MSSHSNPSASSLEVWLKTTTVWLDAICRSAPVSENGTHVELSDLARASKTYWDQQAQIWSCLWRVGAPSGLEAPEDRRFLDREWHEHPWYNAIRRLYLANSRLIADVVESADLDASTKEKLRFFANQLIDAASPTNFAATNPEVARLAQESGGKSLAQGLANLSNDLARRQITITDEAAFEVGRNVAVSPGSVVFECELMELIQYAPLTEQVACRPLVIVPPCVNKFYILDLQPANSFVRYACEQGYTVFLVSWRNPDASLGDLRWDDYVESGVCQAIRVARSIARADKVNTLGWCVGGTLLACALAVQRASAEDTVASMTLLTTLLDFAQPGDLGAFVDETSVRYREAIAGPGSILSGKDLALVFQMLRANDLLWPYHVDQYLKGGQPPPFDLLYWNADTTNLPGSMVAWLLRNTYLENNLRVPGKVNVCGHPLDLGSISVPSYVLAAEADHIVPWQAAYKSALLIGSEPEFVLASSGHIAGVINPPSAHKRSYRTRKSLAQTPDAWLADTKVHPGSWWTHWSAWLRRHAGKAIAAPTRPGNDIWTPLAPAPGRYVKVRTL
ncbi:class I poly(R)-hydroxyalkanoic acid synthase [Paraburkholderia sp. A3BS-1L]|uniref:PHA/PHB synthase family protein n=1 Tax=Paraburkholderia sp. A3BS-1L TaxID=3028375 RepID=UPI003DA893D9